MYWSVSIYGNNISCKNFLKVGCCWLLFPYTSTQHVSQNLHRQRVLDNYVVWHYKLNLLWPVHQIHHCLKSANKRPWYEGILKRLFFFVLFVFKIWCLNTQQFLRKSHVNIPAIFKYTLLDSPISDSWFLIVHTINTENI